MQKKTLNDLDFAVAERRLLKLARALREGGWEGYLKAWAREFGVDPRELPKEPPSFLTPSARSPAFREELYAPVSDEEFDQAMENLKSLEDLWRLPTRFLPGLLDLPDEFLEQKLGLSEEQAQYLLWHLRDLEAGISGFNMEVEGIL
jgi:hypothetical protein